MMPASMAAARTERKLLVGADLIQQLRLIAGDSAE
jgi:hypothetical protein